MPHRSQVVPTIFIVTTWSRAPFLVKIETGFWQSSEVLRQIWRWFFSIENQKACSARYWHWWCKTPSWETSPTVPSESQTMKERGSENVTKKKVISPSSNTLYYSVVLLKQKSVHTVFSLRFEEVPFATWVAPPEVCVYTLAATIGKCTAHLHMESRVYLVDFRVLPLSCHDFILVWNFLSEN